MNDSVLAEVSRGQVEMDEFLVIAKKGPQLLLDVRLRAQHLLNVVAREALNHVVVGEVKMD